MRCEVEVQGLDGIRHRVDVDANTLFEAAAMGIALLKKAAFQVDVYPLMDIHVKVYPPATLHVIRYEKLTGWVNGPGSPNEIVAKSKLKKILDGD